jgi:glycosyltransferase involved in cell wall biosynthesis
MAYRAAAPSSHRNRPVRIAVVANTGWNIARFRSDLIASCRARGWEVDAIAAFDGRNVGDVQRLGARVVDLPIDAAGHNPLQDGLYLVRLARLLRRLRPDLVHLFGIKPAIYGTFAGRAASVGGLVASLTGSGILGAERKRWLRPMLRVLLRAGLSGRTIAIFQNRPDLDAFVARRLIAPDRALYVPGSGIDTAALIPDLELPAVRRTCFLMASRMLWSKGVAQFVEAARLVRLQAPQASFVLFGGTSADYGSKNPDFIDPAWLEALNREGVVAWRGWTSPAEVEAAMRSAAAVVLPSYYGEGLPRCLIEAAAAGAPIITTDMPGCRDAVIDGRSGFVCPPRSAERVAEAMLELLAWPERITAMGLEGRRLAETIFDKEIVNQRLFMAYERALAGPREPAASTGRGEP